MSKVQHRSPRIIIGFFVPAVVFAFIASLLVAIGANLPYFPPAFGSVTGFIGIILSGWIMGGLQSAIYTFLHEFTINPRIKNDHHAIIISGGYFSVSVWTIVPGFPISLLAIGFLSGCAVGFLLRDMYKHYA